MRPLNRPFSRWALKVSNPRPSPCKGEKADPRRRASSLRCGSSQSFAIRIEREADVPLVEHGLNSGGTEQRSLFVEHVDALWKRDATKIHESGEEAS